MREPTVWEKLVLFVGSAIFGVLDWITCRVTREKHDGYTAEQAAEGVRKWQAWEHLPAPPVDRQDAEKFFDEIRGLNFPTSSALPMGAMVGHAVQAAADREEAISRLLAVGVTTAQLQVFGKMVASTRVDAQTLLELMDAGIDYGPALGTWRRQYEANKSCASNDTPDYDEVPVTEVQYAARQAGKATAQEAELNQYLAANKADPDE